MKRKLLKNRANSPSGAARFFALDLSWFCLFLLLRFKS